MDPATAICTGRTYRPGWGGRTPGDTERARTVVVRALSGVVDGAPTGVRQLKLSPQAHELPALGLSIVKPCFSMVSAKSMVAPSR